VYLSSLHFGVDKDHNKYLHLNDINVDALDTFFHDAHTQCALAVCNVEIRVMLGGAGGAYHALFSDYQTYYTLLKSFLNKYTFIRGIDLDVEEILDDQPTIALARIQRLIRSLDTDFKHTSTPLVATTPFTITMAPVASSLADKTTIGLGGFS
jgi:hypothetical protein